MGWSDILIFSLVTDRNFVCIVYIYYMNGLRILDKEI